MCFPMVNSLSSLKTTYPRKNLTPIVVHVLGCCVSPWDRLVERVYTKYWPDIQGYKKKEKRIKKNNNNNSGFGSHPPFPSFFFPPIKQGFFPSSSYESFLQSLQTIRLWSVSFFNFFVAKIIRVEKIVPSFTKEFFFFFSRRATYNIY